MFTDRRENVESSEGAATPADAATTVDLGGWGDAPPTVPMSNGGGSERPGDWICPYTLLKVIGEGGFGVFYG